MINRLYPEDDSVLRECFFVYPQVEAIQYTARSCRPRSAI